MVVPSEQCERGISLRQPVYSCGKTTIPPGWSSRVSNASEGSLPDLGQQPVYSCGKTTIPPGWSSRASNASEGSLPDLGQQPVYPCGKIEHARILPKLAS